ncbi:MAG: YfiR family protein [Moraxellaceae bacterium]|nr:YfiR family protein [Moraxellaceae bacterium]
MFARGEPTEDQIKAAFVYNFAKFVEWPETAFPSKDAPLVLCVLGKDNVGSALQILEKREVQGRQLRLNVITRLNEYLQNNSCHILFIASSESSHQEDILNDIGNAPLCSPLRITPDL